MSGGERERRNEGSLGRNVAPYAGTLGRTRTEPVQVWMPDGTIRALSVYVGVDAEADPALATLARAGTLHHIADGVELAIPFVYHARAERLMLLVVPEGLRHRALALRAEHLALLAADPGHALPDYVRDAEVVIGHRGLAARLSGGAPLARLQSVALDDELSARALAQKERDLMRRERLLRAREQAVRELERMRRSSLGNVDDSELEVVEDDAQARADYEPALVAAEFTSSGEVDLDAAAEAELLPADADAEVVDGEEVSSDESRDEAEVVDAIEDVEDGEVVEATEAVAEEELEDALLQVAPAAFLADSEAELWLTERDGRVWLFVRHRPSPPRDVSGLDLLLQLDPGAEVPVALLTLVFDVNGSPEVRRGAIDPNDPAQVRALTLLSEHFELSLVSVAGPDDFEPWASLSAAREANARAVLGRLTRKEGQDPEQLSRARNALLRSPPPWRDLSHPFQPVPGRPARVNATEAAVQLDELGTWLQPEKRELVRLLWSVSDELVDAVTARTLGAALDWGLSLPEPLSARAVELGLAPDRRGLLGRRIQGLVLASREPDAAGLEEGVLRAQWSEALDEAARLGVSLGAEAHDEAQKHADPRAVLHAEALTDGPSQALEPLRERALRAQAPDAGALEELLGRGAYRDLLAGCRRLSELPPELAGRLFAGVARRNDLAAVDALPALLGAEIPLRVRVGAALSLAQRRALHGIEPICANLAREDGAGFRLFALALGRYGGGSFRAVMREMVTHKVDAERTTLVLALLCCHGARAQVKAKARSTDKVEAGLAERALALAVECRSDEWALMALEAGADLAVFCRIFDGSFAAAQV